jgi:hypothetical protein
MYRRAFADTNSGDEEVPTPTNVDMFKAKPIYDA